MHLGNRTIGVGDRLLTVGAGRDHVAGAVRVPGNGPYHSTYLQAESQVEDAGEAARLLDAGGALEDPGRRSEEPVAGALLPARPDIGVLPQEDAHQCFTEDLIIAYVVDAPKTIRYLTNKHLADLKLSVEQLHRIALTNLKRILPAPEIREESGLYQIHCGGTYEASLLFLNEFWDKRPFRLRGEIVVAVPARDAVLVTGSGYPEGIQRLSELAHEAHASSPYRVTSELLIRREGKFVPYRPTGSWQ